MKLDKRWKKQQNFVYMIYLFKYGGVIIMRFMSFLSKVYLFRIFGLNLFEERRRRKKRNKKKSLEKRKRKEKKRKS
jgi:DMSO/TMAO reductase YedYZ heme-binding membrane subunit